MEERKKRRRAKKRLRAGGANGSGGAAAGTAGILALPDDVMVCILQHVKDGKTLLVVIPSVGEPGRPGPDGLFYRAAAAALLDPCARCRPFAWSRWSMCM